MLREWILLVVFTLQNALVKKVLPLCSQSFLGYNDFYCESGLYWHPGGGTLYTEPLWDGKNCEWKEVPCCTSSRLPWFYQALPTATSHNIEFRVCSAGDKNNEDVAFDQVEFYVK